MRWGLLAQHSTIIGLIGMAWRDEARYGTPGPSRAPRYGRTEEFRKLVIRQNVDNLAHREVQLVTQLREALFERRSNMQKMFKSVDLNEDGIVTLEEFLHALEGAGIPVGHEIDRARAYVTQEEAARMMSFFDRDNSGYLRYNEFMRLLQGTIEMPSNQSRPPEPQYARRLTEQSSGSDAHSPSSMSGSLSTTAGRGLIIEAVGLQRGGSAPGDIHKIQDAFRKWDVNGDGCITENELLQVIQKLDMRFSAKQVRQMFLAADLNNDGVINYDEFVQWLFK